MQWVFISLVITVIVSSTTFNAITVALPKVFEERLQEIASNTAYLGFLTFAVYLFGALSQFIVGQILDKKPLKKVFMPFAVIIVPSLYLASTQNNYAIILLSIVIISCIFGQGTIK
jgi:MFS family permease